jgi:predicted dienelactone hydrolase
MKRARPTKHYETISGHYENAPKWFSFKALLFIFTILRHSFARVQKRLNRPVCSPRKALSLERILNLDILLTYLRKASSLFSFILVLRIFY